MNLLSSRLDLALCQLVCCGLGILGNLVCCWEQLLIIEPVGCGLGIGRYLVGCWFELTLCEFLGSWLCMSAIPFNIHIADTTAPVVTSHSAAIDGVTAGALGQTQS